MVRFVNLHTHTNLGSMLDCLIGVDELFDKVKEFGQESLAITDHGTLASHLDAFKAYKRTGVKFIPGCEQYLVNSYDFLPEDKEAKRKIKKTERRKHIILLAQNQTGYKNLLKINFIGFQNRVIVIGRVFPRISVEDLSRYTDGLICTSACANGPISRLIIQDKQDEAAEMAQHFMQLFPDRFFIELHPHLLKDNDVDQDLINKKLIYIANKFGIPLVVATDIHYETKASEKYHDMLLAINAKKPVDDPTRHRYGIDEFYVKTGEEVYGFLEKHYGKEIATEAVENTVKIANMCEAPDYMETKGNHLPVFNPNNTPDFKEFSEWKEKVKLSNKPNDLAYMRFRCIKGFKEKFGELNKEDQKLRWERVKKELEVLEGNNFSSYMLVVADFIRWAKENNILVGGGRGCLSGNTLVLTNSGFESLKNIKINDVVFTHTGNLKEVENVFKYDVDENLLEIKTDFSFGKILLTKDHKIWALKAERTEKYKMFLSNSWIPPFKGKKYIINNNPSWIKASDLQKDDYIFMPFPKIRRNIDVETLDLSLFIGPHDKVVGDNIISNISLVNQFGIRYISKKLDLDRGTVQRAKRGKKILNSTKNEIFNYLKAQGTIFNDWQNDSNVKKRVINKTINVDEDFCYVIGRWIGDGWINDKNQSYSIGIAFNRNDEVGKNRVLSYFRKLGFYCNFISHKSQQLDQLMIYSYLLTGLFRNLFPNYKDKSSTKYIGDWKYLPDNKLKALLNGIIDSDGYRGDKTQNSIDTTSEQLVKDLREAFLYLKIVSSVTVRQPYLRGKYQCNKSFKIRFYLNKTSKFVNNRLFENGYYIQIKEILEKHTDKVYDIQVKDDRSYITQNYAVHNSVGGSLVAYLLGIHSVDPLEYGLLFERFQNAYKKDLPDIDTDFTSAGRDLVKDYCRSKYGVDSCAQISNINTFTPKNVIPELVKSMRNVIPELVKPGQNYVEVSDEIKKAIPEEDGDKRRVLTMEKALELSSKLREFANICPELMEYADAIVGLPKEYSTHAAGLIISDIPIIEFVPLRIDKNGEVAVQYDKDRCESIGLVKMDFLAISILDVIDETFKNIKRLGIDGPKKVEDIPLNDKETYEIIKQGHTKCVFQLGKSSMMVSLCKLIKPENILDIATINALGRPSSSNEERKEYVSRKFGKKEVSYLHPSLENSLKETYGLGIFEEQLMTVAQDVAGWDLSKADGLRKLTKLKGKNPKLALQLEVDFIEGTMKKHGVSYEKAKEIWDKTIALWALYGFNKSHAVFYSINSYITAYLKCHYPAAFLTAYLKIKSFRGGLNKEEEITMAKNECRRIGIKIVPPDVNKSGAGYEILNEKTIVMGLSAIKGMGEKAINEIINNQPFQTFIDFLNKVEARVVNKKKLEVMAKAGCFDSMGLSRKFVYDEGKTIRDKLTMFLRKKVKDGYDSEMAIDEFPLNILKDEWDKSEILGYEQEVLGELISGDNNDLFPGFFTGINATPISRLRFLPDRQNVIVEFLVKSFLREFKIKNGRYTGQKMMKYHVEDMHGADTELTIWPSEYAEAKKLLKEGFPARAQCQVSDFNGTKTLMLRQIEKVYNK